MKAAQMRRCSRRSQTPPNRATRPTSHASPCSSERRSAHPVVSLALGQCPVGRNPACLVGPVLDQRDLQVAANQPDPNEPTGTDKQWAACPECWGARIAPCGGGKRAMRRRRRIGGNRRVGSANVHVTLDGLRSHGGRTLGVWPAAIEGRGSATWSRFSERSRRIALGLRQPNPTFAGTALAVVACIPKARPEARRPAQWALRDGLSAVCEGLNSPRRSLAKDSIPMRPRSTYVKRQLDTFCYSSPFS